MHFLWHLSHDTTKPTKWVCTQQRQISLGIRPVWSQSLLCAQWVAKNPSFLHADSEDSDQTGQMPSLIWVFTGRTAILLVLSYCGSFFRGIIPKYKNRDHTCLFHCINICRVPQKMFEHLACSSMFKQLPQDLANVNAWKNVWSLYLSLKLTLKRKISNMT